MAKTTYKDKVGEVAVAVEDIDGTRARVTFTLNNGATLRLEVGRLGYLRLDHDKAAGFSTDPRTILDGFVSPRKRSFSVYSSNGYANAYKGKPLTTPIVKTATKKTTTIPSVDPAKVKDKRATKDPAAEGKPLTAIHVTDPAALSVGAKVTRAGDDTGEVVGHGSDAIGAYVEVEWANAGYESLYADDLKAMKVQLLVSKETSTNTSSTGGTKTGGTKKVKKATFTHDTLAYDPTDDLAEWDAVHGGA